MAKPTGRTALTPWGLGVYGALVSVAGVWIPGFWGDEGASVTMARKPLGELVDTAREVDGVHAAYYLLLKTWGTVFGFSEGATRILSGLAIGLTCVALVYLADRVADRATGVAAAALYPLLPVVFHQASEARSYAAAGLLATGYVLACSHIWDRPDSWRRWGIAGVVAVVMGWLFLFTLLLVPVVLIGLRRDEWWWALRRGIPVMAVAGVAVAPVVVLAMAQRGQIAWIPHLGERWLAEQIATEQFFLGGAGWVVGGWLLAAVGLLRLIRSQPGTAALLVGWLVVPLALLLAGDVVVPQVLYQGRYLIFTAPALMLLVGSAVTWPRPRAVVVGAAVALAGVGVAPQVQERWDVDSKSSWVYAEHVLAERAEPDDGLITFAPLMTVAENVYPEPMAELRLLNDDPDSPWLTAAIYPRMGGPLPGTLTVPDDVHRIWYLSERTSRDWRTSDPDADTELLEERGFRPTWSAGPEGYDDLVITLFER